MPSPSNNHNRNHHNLSSSSNAAIDIHSSSMSSHKDQPQPLHESGEPQSPSVASRRTILQRPTKEQPPSPSKEEAGVAVSSSSALEMTRGSSSMTSNNRHMIHASQHSSSSSTSRGGLADQFSSSLASIANHNRNNHRSNGSYSDSNSSSSGGTGGTEGAAVVTGSSGTPATTSSGGGSGEDNSKDNSNTSASFSNSNMSSSNSGSGSGSDNGSSGHTHHTSSHAMNESSSHSNGNNSNAVGTTATASLTSNNLLLAANNRNNASNNNMNNNAINNTNGKMMMPGHNNSNANNVASGMAALAVRHHLHHHSHHSSNSSGIKQRTNKRGGTSAGDDYGLPVPIDDRLGDAASAHATVVARLPPPSTDSSGSGGETTSNNEGPSGSNNSRQRTLLDPHREPAYHTIVRTFKKLPTKHRDPTVGKKKRKKRSSTKDDVSSGDSSGGTIPKYKNPNKHHHHHSSSHHSGSGGALKQASSKEAVHDPTAANSSSSKMASSMAAHSKSSSGNANPPTSSSSSSKKKKSSVSKQQQKVAHKRKGLPSLVGGDGADKQRPPQAAQDDDVGCDSNNEANGSNSSGSGTEAGYAGSASNNENNATSSSSNSSDIPDFSSGASETNASEQGLENCTNEVREVGGFAFSPSNSPSLSSSSTGDGDASSVEDYEEQPRKFAAQHQVAAKPAAGGASLLEPPRKRARSSSSNWPAATAEFSKITRVKPSSSRSPAQLKDDRSESTSIIKNPAPSRAMTVAAAALASSKSESLYVRKLQGKPPIMQLGSDLMAHVLTFLEPPDILQVLTMPLSKDWQATFASQQELWRVLCLLEPFKALVEDEDFSSSSGSSGSDDDGSLSSFSTNLGGGTVWGLTRHGQRKPKKIGRYRLLYTSFVRCMRYLAQIKDDVIHGRPPTMIDYGVTNVAPAAIGANRSLHNFFAGARGIVEMQQAAGGRGLASAPGMNTEDAASEDSDEGIDNDNAEGPPAAAFAPQAPPAAVVPPHAAARVSNLPILSADDGSHSFQSSVEEEKRRRNKRKKKSRDQQQRRKKKPKYGRSMLTDRLLAPAPSGAVNPANVNLPWSCALYSIVNWMVAFADVEGIQIMCLKVLPYLLEDEQQRITAQRVGLTDVVLRGMILFPDSVALHTASFHTIVLLARPLGGREGMLFHSSMVNSAGIFSGGRDANGMFSGGAQDGKNGIAVMLDSMRRFVDDEALQAMSCWSLVNIALAPVQKEVLVKLGGIEVTANAMMRHPHNAEVQFRALFALINLVIPSVNLSEEGAEDQQDQLGDVNEAGITEELDEMVGQISDLVVLAMKNFCSSEAILNRACLVLHNLSLTQAYHTTLLWTPNCYQMLEWCLANYRTDQVLQQSAAGTLHRLQVTLSNDDNLRARFAASIQAQQQLSLEAAHREALHIYEQQEQLRQERNGGTGEP